MTQPDIRKYLYDVLAAGELIHKLARADVSIADEVVWGVLEDHLPRLIEEVKSALEAAGADPV